MTSVPARVERLALFGPPLLLEGEDAAIYNELLARICAAVQVDVIDDIEKNEGQTVLPGLIAAGHDRRPAVQMSCVPPHGTAAFRPS